MEPSVCKYFIAGYPCMTKRAGPSYHLMRRARKGERVDQIGVQQLHRHRCYMDSMPSIIAANAAAVDEAGESLPPAADEPPAASTLSSLRVQPDFSLRSAGQTTRLKFALYSVRFILMFLRSTHTWETMHP